MITTIRRLKLRLNRLLLDLGIRHYPDRDKRVMPMIDCSTITIVPGVSTKRLMAKYGVNPKYGTHVDPAGSYIGSTGNIYLNPNALKVFSNNLHRIVSIISHETMHKVAHNIDSKRASTGIDDYLKWKNHYVVSYITHSGLD